jgi:hypothetical protein
MNSTENKKTDEHAREKQQEKKTHSFSVDRKGESSAGALAGDDKKRAVPVSPGGSNNR